MKFTLVLLYVAVIGKSWALNSTVTVFINVVDENDNSPVFQQTHYVAGVPVNADLDEHVMTVTVSLHITEKTV